MTKQERLWLKALPWFLLVAGATTGLWLLRNDLDRAHAVLAYLLIVLGASAQCGRTVGFTLAVLSFFCFNFFLLPPYHTYVVADPLDWLVLAAFLITSAVATQLLYRAQRAAEVAEQRADEVDRLSAERVRLAAEAEHAEALREADRLKDALITSVSHDLCTPLTTIKAHAHALRTTGDERATIIEQEADRLNRFVSDLLDLSRLNSGVFPVTTQIIAAEDLLGAALQSVSGIAGGQNVQAIVDLRSPILVGRFDFVQSLRVLVNLIENALKHSPADTPVEVAIRREGEHLVFSVVDRGPGVLPEERDLIWEPFYRKTGVRPDGTGLGLTIARRLATLQGGDVEYRPRPGGGSEFSLVLPAVEWAPAEEISL